ncbi:MAG: response regulator [Lachnospiraceae bacterium]|nr:response regulator [Lachnospiraceae bacterium]
MRYNISYELAGFFLLLAMLIICKSNFRERQRVNRYYFLLVYSGMICCALNIFEVVSSKSSFHLTFLISFFVKMFSFGVLPITGYLFYKYIYEKVPSKREAVGKVMTTVILGYLGFFALYAIIKFIGIKSIQTSDTQSGLYLISVIIRDFYVILGILLLLKNRKFYSARNHIAQVLLILFNVVTIVIRRKTTRTTVATVSLVFVCLIFLYAFEIPDFIALSETLKLLEKQRKDEEEAKIAAINASRTKERFLSNMSHEIRTPLNAILGLNEMIIKDEGDEKLREVALSMKEAGRDLLKSMNEVLNITGEEEQKVLEIDQGFVAPKARLLVVDDKEINLFVISRLLKDTKINITAATSGAEAIEILEKNSFDLLIIDHMMPNMDGIELLKYIREHGMCPGVPAIAFTANAIEGAEKMYLEKGFAGYLAKPAGREAACGILKKFLPKDLLEEKTESETEDVKLSEADEILLNRIMNSSVVDVGGAVAGFDSVASYLEVLRHFMLSFNENAEEIKGYAEEGLNDDNLKLYTIAVHSMKSAAALVGIYDLSELSKKAEHAAKDNDMGALMLIHGPLIEKLGAVKAFFESIDEDTENNEKDADVPALLAVLALLSQAMEEFDVDSMDEHMRALAKMPIFDSCTGLRKKLEKAVNNLDTEAGLELICQITALVKEGGESHEQ